MNNMPKFDKTLKMSVHGAPRPPVAGVGSGRPWAGGRRPRWYETRTETHSYTTPQTKRHKCVTGAGGVSAGGASMWTEWRGVIAEREAARVEREAARVEREQHASERAAGRERERERHASERHASERISPHATCCTPA